jgi:hypothetical protein
LTELTQPEFGQLLQRLCRGLDDMLVVSELHGAGRSRRIDLIRD